MNSQMRNEAESIRRVGGLLSGVALVALVLLGVGCATEPRVATHASSPLPAISNDVVFQAGDVVEIKFQFWPEMNEVQTIRPDGKITLPMVNEVVAESKSPEELRLYLLDKYQDKLKDPEIIVIARVEQNRLVHVGGEVQLTRSSDGLVAIPIVGRLTVLEAIMRAGGILKQSASISHVLIIRRIGDTQYARTVNIREVFKNNESKAFYVQHNDIIFVPRTKIDRIDQWVDQYLNQTIPSWLNLNVDV